MIATGMYMLAEKGDLILASVQISALSLRSARFFRILAGFLAYVREIRILVFFGVCLSLSEIAF